MGTEKNIESFPRQFDVRNGSEFLEGF